MNYIVTDEQLRVMISNAEFGYASTARRFVESLKPIEPLSDKDLSDLYTKATSYRPRNQDKFLAFSFGRAIEAHIIGEDQ